MNQPIPRAKRAFDLVVGVSMSITILPLMLLIMLGILGLEGRPVLYVSRRRLDQGPPQPILKFRTMRRDAERIANRDTVPVVATRFLNLPLTSPLYTPIGRFVERFMLTELPQLLHVLGGRMSIVGNRPLPENVVASLGAEFPDVEDRFLVRGGLTGPVQLVGRDHLSDAERLDMEIAYCRAVLTGYSPMLDFKILAYTILSGFMGRFRFNAEEVTALILRHGDHPPVPRARIRGEDAIPVAEQGHAPP